MVDAKDLKCSWCGVATPILSQSGKCTTCFMVEEEQSLLEQGRVDEAKRYAKWNEDHHGIFVTAPKDKVKDIKCDECGTSLKDLVASFYNRCIPCFIKKQSLDALIKADSLCAQGKLDEAYHLLRLNIAIVKVLDTPNVKKKDLEKAGKSE